MKAWLSLPDSERRPGAVRVGERGEVAANVQQLSPPANALIVQTYHRLLTREPNGSVRKVRPSDYPKSSRLEDKDAWITHYGERWEAQPDSMWIKEAEWKTIVRPNPVKGDSYPLLESVADRMTRAHLIMGLAYGECGVSGKDAVRSRSLLLTVTDVSADAVELRLEGSAALGADFDTSEKNDRKGSRDGQSVQGFEPKVLGYLTYNRRTNAFSRFELATRCRAQSIHIRPTIPRLAGAHSSRVSAAPAESGLGPASHQVPHRRIGESRLGKRRMASAHARRRILRLPWQGCSRHRPRKTSQRSATQRLSHLRLTETPVRLEFRTLTTAAMLRDCCVGSDRQV